MNRPHGGGANARPAGAIDLNGDVGEGFDDTGFVPLLSSASIACGGHAGDAATMAGALDLARAYGVTAGAHPGFADRAGFGRRAGTRDADAIAALVAEQLSRLAALAADRGVPLRFVKPHGALYNLAAADPAIAAGIARGVARTLPGAPIVLAAGSTGLAAIAAAGSPAIGEAFADRAYLADGRLVPRGEPGAVIVDGAEVARRAIDLADRGFVAACDGTPLDLAPRTLCLHGDTPGAAALARRVREALAARGIAIRPFA